MHVFWLWTVAFRRSNLSVGGCVGGYLGHVAKVRSRSARTSMRLSRAKTKISIARLPPFEASGRQGVRASGRRGSPRFATIVSIIFGTWYIEHSIAPCNRSTMYNIFLTPLPPLFLAVLQTSLDPTGPQAHRQTGLFLLAPLLRPPFADCQAGSGIRP